MFITLVSTMNYNEKVALDTWSKRTQTKPILIVCRVGGEPVFGEESKIPEIDEVVLK
jgi:hypothetical protein